MIIAVDFDNTIATKTLDATIGDEVPGALAAIREFKSRGDTVILWTCRGGDLLDAALQWAGDRGIEFDAVNKNVVAFETSCKVWADRYIDDAALGVPLVGHARTGHNVVDWSRVSRMLLGSTADCGATECL